jgi:hypothetical protein
VHGRHLLVLAGGLIVLALLSAALARSDSNPMLVGAAEDSPKNLDPVVSQTKMSLARSAGPDAIRLTTIWKPGQTEVGPSEARGAPEQRERRRPERHPDPALGVPVGRRHDSARLTTGSSSPCGRGRSSAGCRPFATSSWAMFHVSDEAGLLAWQSAMFYADDTPMASLHAVHDAAMAARDFTLRCG